MKLALTNLCDPEDFTKHEYYQDSIGFLREAGLDYLDFFSERNNVSSMVEGFNQALYSDAELIWVIRGGLSCLLTLDEIDRTQVVSSKKKFYGLSDFTHYSTKAASLWVTCYYWPVLAKIKQYFSTVESRQFIVDFLKTGTPNPCDAMPLHKDARKLDLSSVKIVWGHMLIFAFMQNKLDLDLTDRYLFLEYHHSDAGKRRSDLEFYVNQILYVIKNNLPRGFILGKSKIKNIDGSEMSVAEVNNFFVSKLSSCDLPIYYIDHYNNIITFS